MSLSVGTPCSLPALRRAIVLRAPPPADADADVGDDDDAASLELRAVAAVGVRFQSSLPAAAATL